MKKWITAIGQAAVLIAKHEIVYVQRGKVLNQLTPQLHLAAVGAGAIARRSFEFVTSAASFNLPPYATAMQMISDETKPLSLRLGFDDLQKDERILRTTPHAPFVLLAPTVVLIMAGLQKIPHYLSQLESTTETLELSTATLAMIALGVVPNFTVLEPAHG